MSMSKKTKAVLLLIAIFLAGYLSGIGSAGSFESKKPRHGHWGLPEAPSEEHLDNIVEKYRTMLELEGERLEKVRSEIYGCVGDINRFNDEVRPKYSKMWENRRAAIESHLNEAQAIIYRTHQEERKRKREERAAKNNR